MRPLALQLDCSQSTYIWRGTVRMGTAGVREAKARLSRLIRDVQRGKEWVITEHGRPVARLVAVRANDLPMDERVRRLEDSGVLEPVRREPLPVPPPLPLKKGLAQQWLQEDRSR